VAVGLRRKLADYSLDPANEVGGSKARGFELILGITIADIDYLEGAIQTGVLVVPVASVRDNPPYGVNCVAEVPVRGLGEKRERVVNVRTVWVLAAGTPPRLATAFPRP
jgi:filamentous hemagglutinin